VLGVGQAFKGKIFVWTNAPRRGQAHLISPFGYMHLNVPQTD
jgi:hypothetical protein